MKKSSALLPGLLPALSPASLLASLQVLLLALLLALIFIQAVAAVPDEAVGRVVGVLSGDSFGVEILQPDERTKQIDRVLLADVESPSTLTPEGKAAREFTTSELKNRTVFLDIDDSSTSGRSEWGLLICVVYLMDEDSRPVWPPYNRILVDSGQAVLKEDPNNEFDSAAWWGEPPEMKLQRPVLPSIGVGTQNPATVMGPDETSVIRKDEKTGAVSIGLNR